MNKRPPEDDLHRRAMEVLRLAMDALPDQRHSVIDRACAGDTALLHEALSLFEAHENAGAFLEGSALREFEESSSEHAHDNAQLLIGKRIGRYVITALLGRGGMGAVFLARQDEPERDVALKILPAAMLAFSRDALRRFRHESRALARLQHPGIASIYEAGTHDDGSGATPFFAMEHIANASPITTFAQRRELSIAQRLSLFVQACDAVHYGHQRGVIHRDLKPANILVDHDGIVKIIDFGIARVLSIDDATDAPITATNTAVGRAIGTPAYMSPEQAAGASNDLDIRTDVFALGVVLSHLLSEPEADSKSSSSLPVDLQTIISKATSDVPDRRYQSVADLARDVHRYSSNLPIEARPPSRLYALKLFVRRNRAMVAAATLMVALLLTAIVGTTFGLMRARAAERAALEEAQRSQAISGFLGSMFRSPDPSRRGGDVRVMDLLQDWEAEIDRRFANDPVVQSFLHSELGLAYMGLGTPSKAEPHLQQAIDIRRAALGERDERTHTARVILASLRHRQSRLSEAEKLYSDAIVMLLELSGPDADSTLVARNGYALLLRDLGRLDEAESMFRDILQRRLRTLGRLDDATASTMNNLALLIRQRGDIHEAERLYLEVLEIDRAVTGEQSVRVASTMNNLGALYRATGRLDEAEEMFHQTLEMRRALLHEDHPDMLLSMSNMAMMLVSRGKLDEAEPALRQTMDAHLRVWGGQHLGTLIVSSNYARLLVDLGRADEAVAIAERVVRDAIAVLGEQHWRVAWFRAHLGSALALADRFEEAEPILLQSYESLRSAMGERDAHTLRTAGLIAEAYVHVKDETQARHWADIAAGSPTTRSDDSR